MTTTATTQMNSLALDLAATALHATAFNKSINAKKYPIENLKFLFQLPFQKSIKQTRIEPLTVLFQICSGAVYSCASHKIIIM